MADGATNGDCAHRQRDKPGAVEGADWGDQAEIRLRVDGAFESSERLAKALAHHPKERVRNPTDGAPINLSNAL